MPSLISLREYPYDPDFLSSEIWHKPEYYEVCSESELWGCAFLLTLEKQVTANTNEALVYLLARLVMESEGWDKTTQENTNIAEFVGFVLSTGYLSDDRGWEISTDEFLVNYEEIIHGIGKEKSFSLTQNGVETKTQMLIATDEIYSVTCFAGKWNNRQYFAETSTHWIFFTWGTGA